MGVGDPNRVAVGGHSYGAFMTANLLTHTKLFKAGIARSGAYNRTLTPFGFQTETRTYWEVPEIYNAMSPFMSADKLHGALLIIHGEMDNNSGTFPIQSERLFSALKGQRGDRHVMSYCPMRVMLRRQREHITSNCMNVTYGWIVTSRTQKVSSTDLSMKYISSDRKSIFPLTSEVYLL